MGNDVLVGVGEAGRIVERKTLEAFVLPSKRQRLLTLYDMPQRRPQVLNFLYHALHPDPQYARLLHGRDGFPDQVLAALRAAGAPETCHVMSVHEEIDGRTLDLDEVVWEVVNGLEGTLLCCVQGRLAYWEGEPPHNQYILQR